MNHLKRHILLSSMGVRPKETTYSFNGVERSSRFSALGLWQLLPEQERPREIWFLLTPQAERECWEAIVADALAVGVPVEKVAIDSNASDDTQVFLERTALRIPGDCVLTLDVTQGLRHHAFLFYALALYLSTIQGVHIQGVWYCRIETPKPDEPKPVIDLKPALNLAHWFHALAVFRDTGSLKPISEMMVQGENRTLVEQLSFFFLNGMPLEAGDSAARLVTAAESMQLTAGVPLAGELQHWLLEAIRPLAGQTFVANPGEGEVSKLAIPLTQQELQRQAGFITSYFRYGQFNLAFGLLREWLVNRVAADSSRKAWLERQVRENIEHDLGGLSEVYKSKDPGDPKKKRYKHQSVRAGLSDAQRDWAKRWSTVCDLRNALQHHGMKPAVFDPERSDIQNATSDFAGRPKWCALTDFGGGSGRLLICPIGLTPGVLYSAILHVRPSRVVVVCSDQSASAISQAVERCGQHVDCISLTMVDPYCGITEFQTLVDNATRWLFEADEVHANLTGGTTLMGVLVGELIKRASREYRRPTREFVLIDKRPPEQQRTDPWQLGDIHYLDSRPTQNQTDSIGRAAESLGTCVTEKPHLQDSGESQL